MTVRQLFRKYFSKGAVEPEPKESTLPLDIYGREIEDGKDYFNPKVIKGIPVFDIDSIYDHYYKSQIKEILRSAGIGEHRRTPNGTSVIEELYVDVIKRYIGYAHMLPASEYHHHSSTGGLVVHSLQVSLYALRRSKEYRPETTKHIDLDKQLKPVYIYAAWLSGLLHDAGKMIRDMAVDALELVDNDVNRRVTDGDNIPQWRPEKESLVDWARRFGVARYTVAFLPGRVHNQHNMDSIQLLAPVVGKGYALDYLVDRPVNIYNKVGTVLSGHETGLDYLSQCVRKADILSVVKDANIVSDIQMGERALSQPAMILRTIRVALREWEINQVHGHLWVLGDAVYLRSMKTFDHIQKVSKRLQYNLPSDTRIIVAIMEESGMIESYDKSSRTVSFAPGVFSDEQIREVFKGELNVPVETLIKVKWKGTIFESNPMPDSAAGLLISPHGDAIDAITADGNVVHHEYAGGKSTSSTVVKAQTVSNDKEDIGEKDSGKAKVVEIESKPVKKDKSQVGATKGIVFKTSRKRDEAKKNSEAKKTAKGTEKKQTGKRAELRPQEIKEEVGAMSGLSQKKAMLAKKEDSMPKDVSSSNRVIKTQAQEKASGPELSDEKPIASSEKGGTEGESTRHSTQSSPSPTDHNQNLDTSPDEHMKKPPAEPHPIYQKATSVEVKSEQEAYWVSLEDVVVFFKDKSKAQSIEELRNEDLLALNDDGKASIQVLRINGLSKQVIALKPPPASEQIAEHALKKSISKPDEDQSSQNASAVGEDYGLAVVMMNCKPNSLASAIKLTAIKTDAITQRADGLLINMAKLAALMSVHYSKRIIARKLLSQIKKSGVDLVVEENEQGKFYLVDYKVLNTIMLKEVYEDI